MTRFSKSALLLGAALTVLSACSGTKGPGELGSKDDIIVRNNGLPGAAKAEPPAADFSSTVEQGQAVPAPEVAVAEPLPDTSPAVEAAAQQVADANAPVPSTTTTPANDLTTATTAPVTEAKPIDQIAPQTPVQDTASTTPPPVASPEYAPAVAPTPAPEAVYAPAAAPVADPVPAPSSVYPAADYAAAGVAAPATAPAAPVPAAVPTPSANVYVPLPAGSAYPLDPNAPYSPKAVAAAGVTAPVSAPVVTASGLNLADPSVIRSAQTALKSKGAYAGEATGAVDAAFLNALTIYQGTNKLPQGGLNEDTLRHLGVIE